METTLRFEAAGPTARVTVDRELGVVVETWTHPPQGPRAVRHGRGALPGLATGWSSRDAFEPPFRTPDGRLWALGDYRDGLSLLQREGGAWLPAAVTGPAAELGWRRAQQITNGDRVERLTGPDGAPLLLEGSGVLVYRGAGVWAFAALQRLGKGSPRQRVAWAPWRGGVVCAGAVSVLVRAGGVEPGPADVRPDPDRRHVRFPGGAWASLGEDELAILGSTGETRLVPLQRGRVIAGRAADDRLLVQGCLRGQGWLLGELDIQGGVRALFEDGGGARDPAGPIVTLGERTWWSDDRGLLRRWDASGLRALQLDGVLEGVDPAGRAWLRYGGVVWSLDLAELDQWLDRGPGPAPERVRNEQRAARLDPDGRLRLLRVVGAGALDARASPPGESASRQARRVSPGPAEAGGAHRRRVLRFHVRRSVAWVLDPGSPEFVDYTCWLHWCHHCHGGGAGDARRAPEGGLPTRPPGGLDQTGRAVGLRAGEGGPDSRALLRRPDGSAWLISPAGLVELELARSEGPWRVRSVEPRVRCGEWVQERDGEVWLVDGDELVRVGFPGERGAIGPR